MEFIFLLYCHIYNTSALYFPVWCSSPVSTECTSLIVCRLTMIIEYIVCTYIPDVYIFLTTIVAYVWPLAQYPERPHLSLILLYHYLTLVHSIVSLNSINVFLLTFLFVLLEIPFMKGMPSRRTCLHEGDAFTKGMTSWKAFLHEWDAFTKEPCLFSLWLLLHCLILVFSHWGAA